MMRHIVIEKAGRWDLALACASLSLVMLVLTGVLYSQHHKPQAAPVLARIIHDPTSFFISARCTRAIYLS
jgi:hypothetical protein